MTLLKYQDKLAQTYGYKPLPDKIRWRVRRMFVKHLPAPFFDCLFSGFEGYPLFSKSGNCISRGFSRVVIGDYGAFVEIAPSLIFPKFLEILHGTEKRLGFQNAKYLWMWSFRPGDKTGTARYTSSLNPLHMQIIGQTCTMSHRSICNTLATMSFPLIPKLNRSLAGSNSRSLNVLGSSS